MTGEDDPKRAEIPQRNSLPASQATWPLTAEAQQPANLPTILGSDTPATQRQWVADLGSGN
jgi:hypothetical protein